MEFKKKIYVKCVCILVLLLLCIALFINQSKNTCDQCTVSFYSNYNQMEGNFIVPISEVYSKFVNDECAVTKQGKNYIRHG